MNAITPCIPALTAAALLGLAACSGPGATAATAPSSSPATVLVPEAIEAEGKHTLIENGTAAKILNRWGLSSEAVQKSELNPTGLPKK